MANEKRMTNREFSEKNAEFKAACEETGTTPTPRQASKFRRKTGRAFSHKSS